jgi:hypothetical protein
MLSDKISNPDLPEGDYPFIDRHYPLAELAMIEVPVVLKTLLIEQAARNGTSIARDAPTELRCVSEQFGDATFLIYWPHGHDMHMLAPAQFRKGNA